MARRKATLRKLPTLARKVARISDLLGGLKRKIDRLIPEITSASMAEIALFRAIEHDRIVLTEKGLEGQPPEWPGDMGEAEEKKEEDDPQAGEGERSAGEPL